MVDPHEVRMAMANGAIRTMDAFTDDETIALCEPVCEALLGLAKNLREHDADTRTITQFLVGMAIAAASDQG
jgi:hypothetical protein